ncbi:MAG: hypothetical protein V7780_15440 [Colwellia sp.]
MKDINTVKPLNIVSGKAQEFYPIPVHSVNNSVRSLIGGLEGLIPKYGKVLKAVTLAIWPKTSTTLESLVESLWEQAEKQIFIMVKKESINHSISICNGCISSIKDDLDYLNMLAEEMSTVSDPSCDEYKFRYNSLINNLTNFQKVISTDSNSIHLIPYLSILSVIHMCILRNRLSHGEKIYNVKAHEVVARREVWECDLNKVYDFYQETIPKLYSADSGNDIGWRRWRLDSIHRKSDKHTYDVVDDERSRTFSGNNINCDDSKKIADNITKDIKRHIFRMDNMKIVNYISFIFELHRFKLGADSKDVITSFDNSEPKFFGDLDKINSGAFARYTDPACIYSPFPVQDFDIFAPGPGVVDKTGTVKSINIGEYSLVLNYTMQLIYQDHDGATYTPPSSWAGNAVTGYRTINLPKSSDSGDSYFIGVDTFGAQIRGYFYCVNNEAVYVSLFGNEPYNTDLQLNTDEELETAIVGSGYELIGTSFYDDYTQHMTDNKTCGKTRVTFYFKYKKIPIVSMLSV